MDARVHAVGLEPMAVLPQIVLEVARRTDGSVVVNGGGLGAVAGANVAIIIGALTAGVAYLSGGCEDVAKLSNRVFERWWSVDDQPDNTEEVILHGVDVSDSEHLTAPTALKAAHFAAEAHDGQMRKTGQDYITHCVETAVITEQLLLSGASEARRSEDAVVAALLHDVVDDAGVDLGELQVEFGWEVGGIVAGVSRLSRNQQVARRLLRSEDGRNQYPDDVTEEAVSMILNATHDPLVLLVKMADRLHNMRTLFPLESDRRHAMAAETMHVWCPLAEKLGLSALKGELEDLSFAVLDPEAFEEIQDQLDEIMNATPTFGSALGGGLAVLQADLAAAPGHDESEEEEEEEEEARNDTLVASTAAPAAAAASGPAMQGVGVVNLSSRLQHAGAAVSLLEAERVPDGAPEAAAESLRKLPELDDGQRRCKALQERVLPFTERTFRSLTSMPVGANRQLKLLDVAGRQLLQEIKLEGLVLGMNVDFSARIKSCHSIYRKMQRKQLSSILQVYDMRALRVIIDDEREQRKEEAIAACYRLVPAVHRLWKPIKGEFDDYIASPKRSGYSSIHSAVLGPDGLPMEVQIRTATMHVEAEYGRAAHWVYKEDPNPLMAVAPGPYPGQPAVRICNARLKDCVVMAVAEDGKRLQVAVHCAGMLAGSSPGQPAALERYYELMAYCHQQGYSEPGQGDFTVRLEEYVLCPDSKYHFLDHLGHKHQTFVTLLEPHLFEGELPLHSEAEPQQQVEAEVMGGEISEGGHATGSVDEEVQRMLEAVPRAVAKAADSERGTTITVERTASGTPSGTGAVHAATAAASASASAPAGADQESGGPTGDMPEASEAAVPKAAAAKRDSQRVRELRCRLEFPERAAECALDDADVLEAASQALWQTSDSMLADDAGFFSAPVWRQKPPARVASPPPSSPEADAGGTVAVDPDRSARPSVVAALAAVSTTGSSAASTTEAEELGGAAEAGVPGESTSGAAPVAGPSVSSSSDEDDNIVVMVYPQRNRASPFLTVRAGTTAEQFALDLDALEASGDGKRAEDAVRDRDGPGDGTQREGGGQRMVNVNNQFVPGHTVLVSGDLVITTGSLLEDL